MLVSRREFHRRSNISVFTPIHEADEMMSVEQLFKELQMDAPFRNHNYMFDDKIDLSKLPLQEESVGIKNNFPHIKTEGERYEKIKQELLADKYQPVPVHRDIDYPCVIYIDDGLHRVFIAHSLGMKFIRVRAKYGKFNLSNSIAFGDLEDLLGMVQKLFGKKAVTLRYAQKFLADAIRKKPVIGETYSLSYGESEGCEC